MSTQRVPSRDKKVIQSNDGDYQGNVWETFNIDLDSNPGAIKTAPRLEAVLDTTQFSTDVIQALTIHDSLYYAISNDRVYKCSTNSDPTDSSNWSSESTLGLEDLGVETDSTSFLGKLLISLGTDIMTWDGSTKDDDWWTVTISGTALTANYPHTLEVLRTGVDTVFVTDKNVVRYYNATAGHTGITLDELLVANTLAPSLDRMWAGTYTEVEQNALVYELLVGDDTANQAYQIDGRACLAMFVYANTPFVVTEKGYIQMFNGAGFVTVAQFPWALDSKVMKGARPGLVQASPTALAIHPKGVKVTGHYAYIYVNAEDEYSTSDDLLNRRGYSGVWVLDLREFSLTHKYALTAASTDYGTAKIDRSGPLLITNTPQTRIMVGGEVNSLPGVWMESAATNQGWFVTTRHEAESVADVFDRAAIKADTLPSSATINVKNKDVERANLPCIVNGITWLDATRFTTTDALADVAEGDEVQILAGYRAGYVANITKVDGTTTKTVTIDESIGAASETSDIQIDAFKKIDKEHTSDSKEYDTFGVSETAAFRQYKVVMKGNVTVRDLISKSTNKNEL